MARIAKRQNKLQRLSSGTTKYDAHHTVLSKTYGALADLRRELSESKESIAQREHLLKMFSECGDRQRAWLLLEDYFDKLNISRKDFTAQDWWDRVVAAEGRTRLEELAIIFLRSRRPLPNELSQYANAQRFAEIERAEQEQRVLRQLERWHFPPAPEHLDSPRARLHVFCEVTPLPDQALLHAFKVRFNLFRPRTGEKYRTIAELVEVTTRATHEQELYAPEDWEFMTWLGEMYPEGNRELAELRLRGLELLQWVARWGHTMRLEMADQPASFGFLGEVISLVPHLETSGDLGLGHRARLPSGQERPLAEVRFLDGKPMLGLIGHTFYFLRNPPPLPLLEFWAQTPVIPVQKLTMRMRTQLRKNRGDDGKDWSELCDLHTARPQFTFELEDDAVRLRLSAQSERDQSAWHWTGQEWQPDDPTARPGGKPLVLEDERLDAATTWLRRLDWFTPEPGLWVGDATPEFLDILMHVWPERPTAADYLGNAAFQRLFLSPRKLRPRLVVRGSGIDWLSVSAEWEEEGLKLTKSDLEQLAGSTGRFVKLPDSGWVELDTESVARAHETMADLGVDGLSPLAQKIGLEQAAHLDDTGLQNFAQTSELKALKDRLAKFEGIPPVPLPRGVQAELRPYQKEGFDFLCHLTGLGLGGILADDMGLGKTLQTLAWLAWLKEENPKDPKPSLVICPASVLHNWRREAERFVPGLKVLVLESGAERHNVRREIPKYDLVVTNYSLLRRDLEDLQKFNFRTVILDEAQFIKNPAAQVSQSVKQLEASQRLALTGTPLENRLLDLWSICDFIQPGYLGDQEYFHETYEPRGEGEEGVAALRIARRRLSAKLRPVMIRRLKQQVAKDLPDRIEERRDCELTESQRKLYLAELRRSREQVQQIIATKGLSRSKMHVLAALTRLRQICCHPALVGNDSASGKTETLLELLEPLLDEGQKVLLFSQFVQMLKLIETECRARNIPTHILTGETKDRASVVQAFQDDPKPAVFLLSLRAAGTGLNLTTASYVVLYDPWWNPAVEAQAIDRSHRIGQTRTVNAYRLIAPGTVEEKIWDLQQRKAQTIADVLGEEGFARSLNQSDLEYLFSET